MSMKLPAMFDQNSPHTFDKILKKTQNKKTLSKLDLEPKSGPFKLFRQLQQFCSTYSTQ